MVSVRPMEQRRRRKQYVTVYFFVAFCDMFVADGLIDTDLVIESGINFGSDSVFCVADGPSGSYGVTEEIAGRPIYGNRTAVNNPHFFRRPSDGGLGHVVGFVCGGE